ncbi:MAG: class I SAM-dependent methyltransferase [Ferruginibacter sp.]
MKSVQDNFTAQAELYAKYRPDYPAELYQFLFSLCRHKDAAWDCGTGSGQVAIALAKHFTNVYATDISEQQIKNAAQRNNIIYDVERAEHTSFEDSSFGLVTVAQAIHWFDFDSFYKEVNRTIKAGGVFAVIGYGLLRVSPEIDLVIHHFYYDIVGRYWDKERKYIDENYATIPFPFEEQPVPELMNNFEWTLDDLLGYFATWSAVQHYKKTNDKDPVPFIKAALEKVWQPHALKTVQFPILLRVAIIDKPAK